MRVLALDTSTSACSVAIWDDGAVLADQFVEMVRGQSEQLVPMIQAVLIECDVRVQDMDMIAVSTGPGAFTGVRIGLATARGLAIASGLPIRGITSLEAVAYGASLQVSGAQRDARWDARRDDRDILALIESKRVDIFTQLFGSDLSAKGQPEALAPKDVAGYCHRNSTGRGLLMLAGDAVDRMVEHGFDDPDLDAVVSTSVHPQAAVIAAVAAERGLPFPGDSVPAPLYLRPPDVKIRADGGRLRP